MPFYLDDIENLGEGLDCKSILIVPCRFCPAASKAVRLGEPYFDFLSCGDHMFVVPPLGGSLPCRGLPRLPTFRLKAVLRTQLKQSSFLSAVYFWYS